MVASWCHPSTLDRPVFFWQEGACSGISRIVADFSAPMVPSAMCESASMRTEFAMCFVEKCGTPVA
jgi:hypothetical protein